MGLKMQSVLNLCILLLVLTSLRPAFGKQYEVETKGLKVRLSDQGQIVSLVFGAKQLSRAVHGSTALDGCRATGSVRAQRLEAGGVEFAENLRCDNRRQGRMIQRFAPTPNSVRWTIEISFNGEPWTTPVETTMAWPNANQIRFWTSWMHGDDRWEDPLEAQPFTQASWDYGPYFGKGISLSLASVLDNTQDSGISLVLSPEDPSINTRLSTTESGTLVFQRSNHRLGEGRTLKFSMDLTAHEADWRGGLRWIVERYPQFFDPINPNAAQMAGTGAYSGWCGPLQVEKLKHMAFQVLWKASFDFPYLGMYLPPVGDNETWQTLHLDSGGQILPGRGRETSYRAMNDCAQRLRDAGFTHLSYFNIGEFGSNMTGSETINHALSADTLWTDPESFLQGKIADGLWRDEHGAPSLGGWSHAYIMDPGAPDYQAYLLEQARRHLEKIPSSEGIAIDRMWWAVSLNEKGARSVNYGADDGIGWYDGRAGRHFSVSWNAALLKIAALMHGAGKVVFSNPCMAYRLDLERYIDGFYDEAWPSNGKRAFSSLNGLAFLALHKPAILWTLNASWIKDDPDAFFQRQLFLGVYPTAPYPENDHSLQPDAFVDEMYTAYGPLMNALRGKRWVLAPHAIEVQGGTAKANLFEVTSGYAAPVVFGGKAESAVVQIKNVPEISQGMHFTALLPGNQQPQPIAVISNHGTLTLKVPLKNGCALILADKL